MAVAYKSAGAGASTETSGAALSPACPATVDAGDVLIAHVFWEGTTTAPSTPSGWTLLAGPEVIQSTIARHWVYGRVAGGTEDGAAVAFGSPAVTTQRAARIYSFSGRVSGDISLLCQGFSHQSHATDPQMPTVTTVRAGALAVALVAQNDNNATGNATGESGGNWTEAVAEYTVALTPGLTIQIQTCIPTANPGTVSGGSVSTTDDPCGVIGFYIQDVAETPKTATETLAVGLTDSAAVDFKAVVCSDTITGFDDTWRLLTDSDTFDSLTVGLTEGTAAIVTVIAATDSCTVQADAVAIITATLSSTDTLLAGFSDDFTGSQAFSVVEPLSVTFSESAGITASVLVTDTLSSGLTDTITQVSAVLLATDSCAAVLSEQTTLESTLSVADSLTAGLTDVFTGSQSLTCLDECATQFTESAPIASSVFASDSLVVQLTDSGSISQASVEAIDSLAVAASELVNVVQNTLISVTDACASALSESSTIGLSWTVDETCRIECGDVFTGSQALTVSDLLSYAVLEDQVSSLPTAALDVVAISISEAASVGVTFTGTDALAIQIGDAATQQDATGVATTPKSASDSVVVVSEEDAEQLVTGPYWNGWAGDEPAPVSTGSYEMGRKENPWKTKW